MKKIALIIIATLVASSISAQNDSLSRLLSTSGPNTIGASHIQLSADIGHTQLSTSFSNHNGVSLSTSARFGIGSRAEISLGISNTTAFGWITNSSIDTASHKLLSNTFSPSVGVRVRLYTPRKSAPQISFYSLISAPLFFRYKPNNQFSPMFQSLLSLQFRNQLSRKWALDYSIGYYLRSNSYMTPFHYNLHYSLLAHYLPTDRLMLSFGTEDYAAKFAVLYQATPNLQLSASADLSSHMPYRAKQLETHALIGLRWLIK